MGKLTLSIIIGVATALTCGCSNTQQQHPAENFTDSIPQEEQIGTLRERHDKNGISIAEKKYVYKYDFVHDESLPVVRNPQGDDYYDNKVTLKIWQQGNEIFSRTFTKKDFKGLVPEKFMTNSALVGFTYNYTKAETTDALYFIATVGDPDETADMAFPIQIRITPDGSISMEKATNLDTEPINPMTVDPSNEGGV